MPKGRVDNEQLAADTYRICSRIYYSGRADIQKQKQAPSVDSVIGAHRGNMRGRGNIIGSGYFT